MASEATERETLPDAWDDLRERYALASADFLQVAGEMDAQQAIEPGVSDGWSAKDVVAHLAAWDWEAERRFRELSGGSTENPRYDIDAFNAAAAEERRDLSWDEALDELRRANMTFGGALAPVSAAEREGNPSYVRWVTIAADHYTEHAAQLRDWLTARTAPKN